MTPAGMALTAGSTLTSQVQDETDEERRKRLLAEQQKKLLPNAGSASLGLSQAGYSAAGLSLGLGL